MNFARKQLEKYGWTDGKGLGKNENGISEALKPKLKRSVTGVGHDPASEFNEHWWSALYDKAAGNVEVHERNGKTKKIKTKDAEDFIITNSTWKINKKRKDKNDEQYSDYFVRTAILGSGGSKTENVKVSDSEEEKEIKDAVILTDEELFAACGGRTAHKGARHGLKALGKLARIAQQEEMLLSQPQYEGYSQAKKHKKQQIHESVEDMTLYSNEVITMKKKKKKRKRCFSIGKNLPVSDADSSLAQLPEESVPKKNKIVKIEEVNKDNNEINNDEIGRSFKLLSRKDFDSVKIEESRDYNEIVTKYKKKKRRNLDNTKSTEDTKQIIDTADNTPVKKKKKLK